ncbi:unnamed protein product [Dracunculus medinensis]|uniref:Ubiquitin-like protease family profile domain-containing protein n=1 Tax=Dracunculus medinensis TaxID=318479 RepID=A0A3P7TG48_DRAME|nr:unnamed protein product [Dracunculus medinensis]
MTIEGYIFRSRSKKLIPNEFQELDSEAHELIKRAWNKSLPLDEKFCDEIMRKDLLTLRGLEWLNDEVINFYMKLICKRAADNCSYPKVYAFTTFFYPTLLAKGYQSVKRWTRKVDIFSFDIILVPIHLSAHWCLAVIDFSNKFIEYYDSMLHRNDLCLETLSDCGVFVCKFAEFISRRADIIFTQEHMPYYRQRMVYEICRQKLL